MVAHEADAVALVHPPTVTIGLWYHLAVLDPSPEFLEADLSSAGTRFDLGGPSGYRATIEPVRHFMREIRGRLAIPLGLLPRVARLLDERGYTVVVQDHRQFGPEHDVDPAVLGAATGDLRRLLDAVVRETRGRIQVGGADERLRSIAAICALFPSARIVVATATRKAGWKLRWALSGLLNEPIGFAHANRAGQEQRVVVSTFPALAAVTQPRPHVFLVADASELSGSAAAYSAGTNTTASTRIYAFVPRSGGWAPGEDLPSESIAGPVIYSARPAAASFRHLVCNARAFPMDLAERGLARKRALWLHPDRNDLLATIGTAYARRDVEGLWRLGLMLAADDERWLTERQQAPIVTLLVESKEHARQLQHRLPGWTQLAAGGGDDGDGDKADPAEGREGQDAPPPPGSIVTQTYAAGHAVLCDVLIRADAALSIPPRSFPPPHGNAHQRHAYVVDIHDERIDDIGHGNGQRPGRGTGRVTKGDAPPDHRKRSPTHHVEPTKTSAAGSSRTSTDDAVVHRPATSRKAVPGKVTKKAPANAPTTARSGSRGKPKGPNPRAVREDCRTDSNAAPQLPNPASGPPRTTTSTENAQCRTGHGFIATHSCRKETHNNI